MNRKHVLVLVLLVVTSLAATPLAAAGAIGAPSSASADVQPVTATADATYVGEDDDPSTEGTIGYVDGVRYDDSLPVDDRDSAVVPDDELEAVVSRSMARVEVIRELTFDDDVPVEVITREEFTDESAGEVEELEDDDRQFENVRLEALFMADQDTDAVEAYETLYGDSVAGYYDTEEAEIVLVAEDPENPELDEVTLGHELLHALQDQHFGLQQFERETTNQDHAALGIIEGDAVWVDTRYEEYCEHEWDCVLPETEPEVPDEFNVGLYLTMFQPYNDGPDYVEAHRSDGGWEAVNDIYDEPPASSSEVIRPGEEREPVEIDLEDTSSAEWERLERADAPDHDTFGEATIAAMFMAQTLEAEETVVIHQVELFDGLTTLNYDHDVTDGWVGDEFAVYTTGDSPDEAAFVWESEWLDDGEAKSFADGYETVIEHHSGEAVDDESNAFVIDEGYPGAYYVDRDGETVTVVRAPTLEDLADLRADINLQEDVSDGDDASGDEPGDDANGDDEERTDTSDDADDTPGFGVPATIVAVLGAVLLRMRD